YSSYHHHITRRSPPRLPLFPYTTLFRSRAPPDRHAEPRARDPRRGPPRRRLLLRRSAGLPGAALPGERAVGLSARRPGRPADRRSEEHTSELQSPDHLVCRLLLEKKKPP